MQTALFHIQKNAQNAGHFMHCQGFEIYSAGQPCHAEICGILGVDA
jgi:hypothetical protein